MSCLQKRDDEACSSSFKRAHVTGSTHAARLIKAHERLTSVALAQAADAACLRVPSWTAFRPAARDARHGGDQGEARVYLLR
jgi:hypothetical protein